MLKRLIFIFSVTAIIISCNNQTGSNGNMLTIEDFELKAADFADQEITIEGTVNHVCKHSGQRMFIINNDPDVSVKIIPGENMANFDAELEGSELVITGTVVEDYIIDKEFLDEWEAEIIKKHEEELAAADSMRLEEEMTEEIAENTDEIAAEETSTEEIAESHEDVPETKVESGDGAGHGDHHLLGMEKVEKWRKKLADSGTEQLVVYMIKATKIEEKTE